MPAAGIGAATARSIVARSVITQPCEQTAPARSLPPLPQPGDEGHPCSGLRIRCPLCSAPCCRRSSRGCGGGPSAAGTPAVAGQPLRSLLPCIVAHLRARGRWWWSAPAVIRTLAVRVRNRAGGRSSKASCTWRALQSWPCMCLRLPPHPTHICPPPAATSPHAAHHPASPTAAASRCPPAARVRPRARAGAAGAPWQWLHAACAPHWPPRAAETWCPPPARACCCVRARCRGACGAAACAPTCPPQLPCAPAACCACPPTSCVTRATPPCRTRTAAAPRRPPTWRRWRPGCRWGPGRT